MSHQDNIRRIKAVSDSLLDLKQEVVFVGGTTVSLYSDREQTISPRITEDVDAIVEVLSYGAHANFEEQLRARGFVHDTSSRVRCRYRIKYADDEIIVDIMPTKDTVAMGFENKWYSDGFKEAMDYVIDPTTTIKILTAPHFLATKMEAFKNRGYRDPRQSKDFEDIVYVWENRRMIWEEVNATNADLRHYLKDEFSTIVNNPNINEWIDCHVSFASPPPTNLIINSIKDFVSGK